MKEIKFDVYEIMYEKAFSFHHRSNLPPGFSMRTTNVLINFTNKKLKGSSENSFLHLDNKFNIKNNVYSSEKINKLRIKRNINHQSQHETKKTYINEQREEQIHLDYKK